MAIKWPWVRQQENEPLDLLEETFEINKTSNKSFNLFNKNGLTNFK